MKSIYLLYGSVVAMAAVSLSVVAFPRTARSSAPIRRCGTYEPTALEASRIESQVKRDMAKRFSTARIGAAPATQTIDVYFHVITAANGTTGALTDAQIASQIAVLNRGFDGTDTLPNGVTPLGPNAVTRFRFVLREIDRTANDTWFAGNDEFGMKSRLRKGGAGALNVYTSNLGAVGLLGFATFPWWYQGSPIYDGVVIAFDSLPGFPGPFGLGKTLTHEVGHWVGLYHTFQGGCSKYSDFVADTAAQRQSFSGDWFPGGFPGVQPDTCTGRNYPGKDPTDNYMDYSNDASYTRFSEGQAARMSALCRTYRGL
ncbi:MAG: zinc metalloprotease [Capsulimonadales bacterium]|nr:zinc metalloprotease [Capsulimonadales bacterium]